MNYTDEAWEEEQMSNLGCESVSDLIAEVERLRKTLKQIQNIAKGRLNENER
jgi:predicted CopG family antitoxin